MPEDFTAIIVKVNGAALLDAGVDALADVRVDLVLGVPDSATLRFQDDWQMIGGQRHHLLARQEDEGEVHRRVGPAPRRCSTARSPRSTPSSATTRRPSSSSPASNWPTV